MKNQIRVLHVDDDTEFAELTSAYLSQESDRISVDTAAGAAEAIDRLAVKSYDCIVSDYEMPEMDGIEFLSAVREVYTDLPFILFTGKGSEEVASDALSAGATDYLQKGSSDRYTLLSNRILNVVEQYREKQRRAALERLQGIVSDVNQALVRSDSREEIEQRVCEILAQADPFQFAAFATSAGTNGSLDARHWAGTGKPFLEAAGIHDIEDLDMATPAPGKPYTGAAVHVTRDVQSAPEYEPWQDLAVQENVQALAVVPLEYGGSYYGLLTIFADQIDVFDESERAMLAGLGDDISHALASIEAREALTREKERFRLLADSAMDAIVTIDAESVVQFANPAVEDVFGYTPDELVGESLTMLMPESFRERHRAAVTRFLETGERTIPWSSIELPGLRKDGEQIDLSISFSAFEDREEVRFEGLIRDVTERKNRERELERYEAITETMQDGVCIMNSDSEFVMVNDAVTELTGYSRGELLGSHASIVRSPTGDKTFDDIQATLDGGTDVESVEIEIETADGETRIIDGRYAQFHGKESGSQLGVWRDISEKKERERRLELYREYTERMFDAIDDLFFVYDRESQLQRWNTAFSEVTGYSDAELDSMNALVCIPEPHVEKVRASIEEVFETGQSRVEAAILTKDGRTIPYEFSADRVEHPDGGQRLVGVGRNISERKRREQALAESERRYRTLAEHFPNGAVFLLDDELRYQLVSGSAFESLSVAPEDLRGKKVGKNGAVSEELATLLKSAYQRALEGEEVTTEMSHEGRTYDLHATPIRDADGEVTQVLAITQDISDRIEQEVTLKRQNERLNEFANIVSHDLRNPLGIADGRIELAQEECSSDHLDSAKNAIERSQALIDDLLTLAREGRGAGDPETVDIESVATNSWRNVPTGDATLNIDVHRTIRADRSRLGQLFENLIRNSVEHGETPPTITIGELDDGFFVADDGPGVPEDQRESVFDPGYTTTSEGTGYGLSIVKQVVDAHGWEICLTESASGGAQFEITGVSEV